MRALEQDMAPRADAARSWFALYTRPRAEAKVEHQLKEQAIEVYLPMRRVLRQWSDRKKWIEEPLFKSYLFIKADAMERYRAVQSYGAMGLVQMSGRPLHVPESDILRIKQILSEAPEVEAADYYTPGDSVEVISGPFTGMQGVLIEKAGSARLLIRIDSVQQGLTFNFSRSDLKKM